MRKDIVVNVKNIAKQFRINNSAILVLDNVNFHITTGEAVAIVGPSGVGKSTLVHIIGGLMKPDSGEINISGKSLYNFKKEELNKFRAENIGFVFQMFYLMPHFNALENIMLPMHTFKGSKLEKRDKAIMLLDKVGLKERALSFPRQLSGGEQQRVSIARALANDANILIADEPTGNLDRESEEKIIDIFNDLKNEGKTIITVTHNQVLANWSDKVVNLSK